MTLIRAVENKSFQPLTEFGLVKEKCKKNIYFIPSGEFNAYLKQIKVILSAVKKYHIFSLVTNRSCYDNFRLNFF